MAWTTIRYIQHHILRWYKNHGRDLPWRQTHDPYRILVSEVMLQQTQVERVIDKYLAFLDAFPTAADLAQAKTSEVIKAWKGLGYNRRALFLQKTAQAVCTQHAGEFPQDLEELKKLPGVGDYTARAILSFAFQQEVPMMDTNHRRFYQRVFFGIPIKKDKELLQEAEGILPRKRSYNWNQALMDMGARICLTRKPKCQQCPVQQWCKAYPEILTFVPPKKKKKKKTIPFIETDRYFRGRIMDYLRDHDSIAVKKVYTLFPDIDMVRLDNIVAGLRKDELIQRDENRILLP